MIDGFYFNEMAEKNTFYFKCAQCGGCCSNIKNSVAINGLDIYNIANFVQISIRDVIEKYTELILLTDFLPIMTLKTTGKSETCVFLKNNKCSIHQSKPYICSIYPLGVLPNDTHDRLIYGIVSRKKHHFTGDEITVKDWVKNNLSLQQKDTLLADMKNTDEVAIYMKRALDEGKFNRAFIIYIFYKYYSVDLSKAFVPQYMENCEMLKKELMKICGEKN